MGIGTKTKAPGRMVLQIGRPDWICHSFVLYLDSCFLVQTHNWPVKFVVEPHFYFLSSIFYPPCWYYHYFLGEHGQWALEPRRKQQDGWYFK